jgi:hypothetical protein
MLFLDGSEGLHMLLQVSLGQEHTRAEGPPEEVFPGFSSSDNSNTQETRYEGFNA